MALTSTGSLETLCVALCGQAGHPGLKISQPARRLHQELGYFFRNSPPPAQSICLAQEKGHRRKALGSGASVTLFPYLLFFLVPTHQPRVSVLGTQEGALYDQPQPHRAASPSPHHLAWLVVPRPPLTGERERRSVTGTAPFPTLVL